MPGRRIRVSRVRGRAGAAGSPSSSAARSTASSPAELLGHGDRQLRPLPAQQRPAPRRPGSPRRTSRPAAVGGSASIRCRAGSRRSSASRASARSSAPIPGARRSRRPGHRTGPLGPGRRPPVRPRLFARPVPAARSPSPPCPAPVTSEPSATAPDRARTPRTARRPRSRAAVTVQRRSTEGSATIRRVPPAVTARSSSTRASSSGAPAGPGQPQHQLELGFERPADRRAVRRTCSSGSGSARAGRRPGRRRRTATAATCQQRRDAGRLGRGVVGGAQRQRQPAQLGQHRLLLGVPLAQPARRRPAQRPRRAPAAPGWPPARRPAGRAGRARSACAGSPRPPPAPGSAPAGSRSGASASSARSPVSCSASPSSASIVRSQAGSSSRPPPDSPASSPRTARRCAGNSRSR